MNNLFEPIKMDPAYRRVAASIESKIMARDLNDGDSLPAETRPRTPVPGQSLHGARGSARAAEQGPGHPS